MHEDIEDDPVQDENALPTAPTDVETGESVKVAEPQPQETKAEEPGEPEEKAAEASSSQEAESTPPAKADGVSEPETTSTDTEDLLHHPPHEEHHPTYVNIWAQLRIFHAVFWLMVVILVVAGVITGAGAAIGWGYQVPMQIFILIVTFVPGSGFLPKKAIKKEARDKAIIADQEAPEVVVVDKPPQKKARMIWLDNLKTFLITGVVLGHTGTAFMGQGAGIGFIPVKDGGSWFMFFGFSLASALKTTIVPCFFAISGFFAPSSLDRKGPQAFLKANFMRLGIAFYVFWLILNPLLYVMGYGMISPTASVTSGGTTNQTSPADTACVVADDDPTGGDFMCQYQYFPNSAHTWFLLWLLMFQTVYAHVEGPAIKMDIPSFGWIFKKALILTLLQMLAGFLCLVGGSPLFAEMPMLSAGDGYFNMAGFVVGIVAKRNKWLEKPLPAELVRSSRLYAAGAMGVITCTLFFIATPLAYIGSTPVFIVYFCFNILMGPLSPALVILIVDFFQTEMNFKTDISAWMADGAFVVYLIHYYFVNIYSYVFIQMLPAGFDKTASDSLVLDKAIGDASAFGGCLFVFGMSVLTCFIIGGAMKKIPVIKNFI